jgi:hypothetical protein
VHQPRLEATVVELGRRTVGLAVKTLGGFRFFSVAGELSHLDGRIFPRLARLYREVRRSAAARAS